MKKLYLMFFISFFLLSCLSQKSFQINEENKRFEKEGLDFQKSDFANIKKTKKLGRFVKNGNLPLFKVTKNNVSSYIFVYISWGNKDTSVLNKAFEKLQKSDLIFKDYDIKLNNQSIKNYSYYKEKLRYNIFSKINSDVLYSPIARLTSKGDFFIQPVVYVDDVNFEDKIDFLKNNLDEISYEFGQFLKVYNEYNYDEDIDFLQKSKYITAFDIISDEEIIKNIGKIFVSPSFLFLNISNYKILKALLQYGVDVEEI